MKEKLFVCVVMACMLSGVLGVLWYNAGVKQRAWAREGCALTHWKVFCGATPLTRVLKEN